MEKRILFTKESAISFGGMYAEPPVSLIRPGHTKIAEVETPLHPGVQQFLRTLKPSSSETWVLINALGAGEWFGDNINGDYFPYKELVNHNDEFLNTSTSDVEKRTQVAKSIPWGYPTFYNAGIYKHHINKDIKKSFGYIKCVVWNEKMKRVEIIVCLPHELCKRLGTMDIVHRINDGEYIDTSMGCRVPYDICSICGNKAKTKAEYCSHINERRTNKDPRGDGQRPYMINVQPKFFDNSFVFIGADKTARVLMKIAHVHNPMIEHIAKDLVDNYGQKKTEDTMKIAGQLYESNYTPYSYDPYDVQMAKVASGQEKEAKRITIEKAIDSTKFAKKMRRRAAVGAAGVGLLSGALGSLALDRYKSAAVNEEYIRQTLRKVAELQKENKHMKLSDIIKYVVPNPKAPDVSKIEGGEPDLPEFLQNDLGDAGLENAINSTARKGIVLKPHEFMRIALRSSGLGEIADKLRGCSPAPVDSVSMPCSVCAKEPEKDFDEILTPLMSMRSIMPPIVTRRIIRITLVPKQEADSPQLRKNDLLDKVSSAYNGYRLWLLANSSELGYMDKQASVDLERGFVFGGSQEGVTDTDIEMTSAYLQRAHWQAGEFPA